MLNTDPGTDFPLTGFTGGGSDANGVFWIGSRDTLYYWNGSINTFITFGAQIPAGNMTTIRNYIKNI